MTTIYVVTSGEYSDYSIEALFSEREMAERFVALHETSAYDHYDIEEYQLDEPVPERIWYSAGCAVERHRAGEVLRYPEPYLDSAHGDAQPREDRIQVNDGLYRSRPYWTTWIEADSAEHARKVASERWRQVIAGQRPVALWRGNPATYQHMVVVQPVGDGIHLIKVDEDAA